MKFYAYAPIPTLKTLYATLVATAFAGFALAQTPAGNSLNISLDEFNNGEPVKYITCGNDAAFNLGDEMTLEIWARVAESNSNQKLMGKVTGSFNSGYLLGIDQGKIYPEVWTPNQSEVLDGFIPPTGFWYHYAVTFTRNGNLVAYINGENVGQVAMPDSPLASNTSDFIIGIAPWDLANFQTWGQLDEVRVWNIALTEQEINDQMFRPLAGNENGLVAYYQFNESSGMTLPDQGPNGLDGTLVSFTDDWMESQAVMGDAITSGQQELAGLWNGNGITDPRFAITDNGLSMTSFVNVYDYTVFGHDGGMGTATSNLPASAPANFQTTGRSWHVTEVGDMICDLNFNLDDAAGGGTALSTSEPVANYTLLWRDNTGDTWEVVAAANTMTGSVVTFNSVELDGGWYAVGVGNAQIGIPSNVAEVAAQQRIKVLPNPSNGQFQINLHGIQDATYTVVNSLGAIVAQGRQNGMTNMLDLSAQPTGVYFLRVEGNNSVMTERLLLQH